MAMMHAFTAMHHPAAAAAAAATTAADAAAVTIAAARWREFDAELEAAWERLIDAMLRGDKPAAAGKNGWL
jgi:adenosylmethionine-8-amino-7-oxononanoate aminotransferase